MPLTGTIALAVTAIIVSFSAIVAVAKMLFGVASEVVDNSQDEDDV